MFTTGSKFFYAVGALALAAAFALGWTTGGNGLGPLSGGYKGSVGDHLGYTILVFTALVSFFLGLVASAFRDADAEAVAQVVGTDAPPAVAPAGVSYWPALSAFSIGLIVLGLVISNVLFVVGVVALGAMGFEWLVQAWSERATGDPATNRAVRNRLMYPFEIPIAGALVILGVVFSVSRVFLAVSADGAVIFASVVSVIVLGAGALVAQKPKISPNFIAVLLFAGAVGVLTAGVLGAAAGERDFEHHGEEGESHSEDEGESHSEDDGSEAPVVEDEEGSLAPIGGGN